MRLAKVFAAGVAAIGMASVAGQTRAALLKLEFIDPTTNALLGTVTDNSAGDTDPSTGRIITNQFIANFGVSIDIAVSNSPGTTLGNLQAQTLNIQNSSPNQAALAIRASDLDYTNPAGSAMILNSSAGGTFTSAAIGDSVKFESFVDPSNVAPTSANPTLPLNFSKSDPALVTESFSGNQVGSFIRGAGPYSLTNITTVRLSPGANVNVSGSTTATAVPEPIWGSAVIGLLALSRRRRSSR